MSYWQWNTKIASVRTNDESCICTFDQLPKDPGVYQAGMCSIKNDDLVKKLMAAYASQKTIQITSLDTAAPPFMLVVTACGS